MTSRASAGPSTSSLVVEPIGVVRSRFREKVDAPRQASVARDEEGAVELFPRTGFEHALTGLSGFSHVWIVFWFHEAGGFRPKVEPPRGGGERIGVFATRSPHRPNPIGLSLVELVAVEGLTVRVRGLDLLDGTPVLDLKPYLAYADGVSDATGGWLDEKDPRRDWEVVFSPLAEEQLAFLGEEGEALRKRLHDVLRLGPAPQAYKRIRKTDEGLVVASKAFRARFAEEAGRIVVSGIRSGYRPKELAGRDDVHPAFAERFGGRW